MKLDRRIQRAEQRLGINSELDRPQVMEIGGEEFIMTQRELNEIIEEIWREGGSRLLPGDHRNRRLPDDNDGQEGPERPSEGLEDGIAQNGTD